MQGHSSGVGVQESPQILAINSSEKESFPPTSPCHAGFDGAAVFPLFFPKLRNPGLPNSPLTEVLLGLCHLHEAMRLQDA